MHNLFSQDGLLKAEQIAQNVGLTTTAYHFEGEEYNASWVKVHEEGEPPESGTTAASLEQLGYRCSNQIQADTHHFLND